MALSFGVTVLPDPPASRLVELMQLGERNGFEIGWTYDSHVLWQESFIQLTLAIQGTSKMKFGHLVTNPGTREHRVDELALPLALDPLVLDEVRLTTHPELLQYAGRASVARLETSDHAVQPDDLEGIGEHRPRRFRRVAVSLMRAVEDEPSSPWRCATLAQRSEMSPTSSPVARSSTAALNHSPSHRSALPAVLSARSSRVSPSVRGSL